MSSKNTLTLHSFNGSTSVFNTESKFFLGNSRSVDSFEKLDRIGEGTYGVVYRAKDKATKEIVALKKVRMENEVHGASLSSLREIFILKSLSHANIVQVKQVVVGSSLSNIFLVMEYVEQDLASLMESSLVKPFKKSEIKCLLFQLLEGLVYLHSRCIIHRDLKLSNLLLSNHGILKIADFGLARSVMEPMTPEVVTLWYRAPEILFGVKDYSYPIDLWSVGCIFAEWIQKKPMFPGATVIEQISRIANVLGSPTEWKEFNSLPVSKTLFLSSSMESTLESIFKPFEVTDCTLRLLKKLLCYDPNQRITVDEALHHEYFFEDPQKCSPAMIPTYPEIRNRLHPVSNNK